MKCAGAMDVLREPWWGCRAVVALADSHHFDLNQDPHHSEKFDLDSSVVEM